MLASTGFVGPELTETDDSSLGCCGLTDSKTSITVRSSACLFRLSSGMVIALPLASESSSFDIIIAKIL
jgi:hypothetical protein